VLWVRIIISKKCKAIHIERWTMKSGLQGFCLLRLGLSNFLMIEWIYKSLLSKNWFCSAGENWRTGQRDYSGCDRRWFDYGKIACFDALHKSRLCAQGTQQILRAPWKKVLMANYVRIGLLPLAVWILNNQFWLHQLSQVATRVFSMRLLYAVAFLK